MLAKVEIPLHRRQRAQKALLQQLLSAERLEGFWLIRLAPGASIWGHIQHIGLLGYLTRLLTIMGIYQVLDVGAWWVIGKGALQGGSFDWAFLWAWVLLLFSLIPFHLWQVWTENLFSTYAGAFFKQRLLHGILKLNPDELRSQGVGQFLGRVMDSEAFEMLALTGGFSFLRGLVETVAVFMILSRGTNGNLLSFLFGIWLFLTLLLCWPYLISKQDWTQAFREMTNDLVERMSGHRTRLAQEDQAHWHAAEDQQVARNLKLAERADRVLLQLQAVVPQGWLVSGMAGIAPSLVFASATPEELALSLGGIFLASQAMNNLIMGAHSIVGLLVAWDQIAPLNQAATRPPEVAHGLNLATNYGQGPGADKLAVLVARDLAFRYAQRTQPVLQGCRLQIQKGDRLLLEGPSGGGKSTLAALLTGLRTPQAGLLLLWGFDQQTIGREEWQRRVVSAPQFHENHVFTETFAFNLLMGRQWPPSSEDLAEAEAICQELHLGALLKRMPAGLQQMVGESGWQLSHGERSRLFIARALLQKADMIVLDESFAALDPENLQRALQCVLERAPTLLVIAHP
jgi:ATP-binding cassette subfamily B protein